MTVLSCWHIIGHHDLQLLVSCYVLFYRKGAGGPVSFFSIQYYFPLQMSKAWVWLPKKCIYLKCRSSLGPWQRWGLAHCKHMGENLCSIKKGQQCGGKKVGWLLLNMGKCIMRLSSLPKVRPGVCTGARWAQTESCVLPIQASFHHSSFVAKPQLKEEERTGGK